jgi:hypothetical protein
VLGFYNFEERPLFYNKGQNALLEEILHKLIRRRKAFMHFSYDNDSAVYDQQFSLTIAS